MPGPTERAPFASGTLVHTREGLRPIESLAVGDWVLSRSEATGEDSHRQVIAVAGPLDRPAYRLSCYPVESEGGGEQILVVSADPAFHVTGAIDADPDFPPPTGWIDASQLFNSQVVEQRDGERARISSADPIWRTRTDGVGWIDLDRWSDTGSRIDFRSGTPVETPAPGVVADFTLEDGFPDRYNDAGIAEEWAYLCPMHGLQVEDFGTFFVGESGFLVRDGHGETA
jgi:hypothetical protein